MRTFHSRALLSDRASAAFDSGMGQGRTTGSRKRTASVPLVLTGGTVIDVTGWGHSARDLQDAVVIVRDGQITDVGAAAEVAIPKGARVIDCTGNSSFPAWWMATRA